MKPTSETHPAPGRETCPHCGEIGPDNYQYCPHCQMDKTTEPVHRIIIKQLGGERRLWAMVSAKFFVATHYGLTFQFGGSRKANKCRITLDPDDLYTVEFWKVNARKATAEKVQEYPGTGAEELKQIFTLFTGLDLNL